MLKKIIPLLFFLALALTINHAYAEEDINVENLPGQLAEHWGISSFAAGLFLSSLLGFAFLFPFMLWKKSGLMVMIVGFSIMGFCIAIGWLPYWILLALTMVIALMFASQFKKVL